MAESAAFYAVGSCLITCALATIILSVYVYRLMLDFKHFKKLKHLVIFIIAHETAIFVRGCMWLDNFNWIQRGTWYTSLFLFLRVFISMVSEMLLVWELTFMYHSTSMQLLNWTNTINDTTEQSVEQLVKEVNDRTKVYKKRKLIVRGLLVLMCAIRAFFFSMSDLESISDKFSNISYFTY